MNPCRLESHFSSPHACAIEAIEAIARCIASFTYISSMFIGDWRCGATPIVHYRQYASVLQRPSNRLLGNSTMPGALHTSSRAPSSNAVVGNMHDIPPSIYLVTCKRSIDYLSVINLHRRQFEVLVHHLQPENMWCKATGVTVSCTQYASIQKHFLKPKDSICKLNQSQVTNSRPYSQDRPVQKRKTQQSH